MPNHLPTYLLYHLSSYYLSIYLSIFLSAGTGKTSQAVLEGLRLLQRGAVSRLLTPTRRRACGGALYNPSPNLAL